MTEMPQKLQTAQVARILRVSRKTVQRWAEDGTLPYLERIGDQGAYVFSAAVVNDVLALRREKLQLELANMGGA